MERAAQANSRVQAVERRLDAFAAVMRFNGTEWDRRRAHPSGRSSTSTSTIARRAHGMASQLMLARYLAHRRAGSTDLVEELLKAGQAAGVTQGGCTSTSGCRAQRPRHCARFLRRALGLSSGAQKGGTGSASRLGRHDG